MAFIRTVPAAQATAEVAAMYCKALESSGHIPNYVAAFSLRPQVWDRYGSLVAAIRGNMDQRRYELVAVATALAVRSSYCALAHGEVLRDKVLGPGGTARFARDPDQGPLTPAEKAMVRFAQWIALDASAITAKDVDELRAHGFSDQELFDIAAAASIRCFFTKMLDALGVEPDDRYADMEPELRDALVVGRPIASRDAPQPLFPTRPGNPGMTTTPAQ